MTADLEDTYWKCPEDCVFDQPTTTLDCPKHGKALRQVVDGYEINPWSGQRDRGL
jgi:hypothetical protein